MSLSDDKNVPSLSLDTSKEVLIKVSILTHCLDGKSCDHVLEIAQQNQAHKNMLNQENQALHHKLADISNSNDNNNDNDASPREGSTYKLKHQRTHNPLSTNSDNKSLDNTSAGQAEDEFVNNTGHKFCILYALWVHMGIDIFKVKLDDTYNLTQRFKNDGNKVQGQLQEIVSLLQEQLNQNDILHQKWVHREVQGFLIFSLTYLRPI